MTSQPAIDTDSPVAAQAEFDPPVAALGGHVLYRLTLNALNEAVKVPEKLPAPAGLTLTPGARGHTFQSGGVRIIPRTTLNYRVAATAAGAYLMPSFVITAYNKAVTVPAARVTFVPPGAPGAREAQRLAVELPPGDIYVGQTLTARLVVLDPGEPTLQLHGLTQVQVTSDAFLADQSYYRVRREAVTREGRAYAALVQDLTLTPIRSGTHTLTVQAHAIVARVFTAGPGTVLPAGPLTMLNPLLESDPLPVVVKSLPREGELPGFTGAIGSFALEPPRLSAAEVRAGEPVTLTVTVRGEGNLGRLVPPKLAPLREWQTFPPSPDPSPPGLIQQRGTCSFSYTLIPLSERLSATPAIPFSYFDPKKAAYVPLTIPPVPLKVKPAPAGATLATPLRPAARLDWEDELGRERELVLTGLAEKPGRRVRSLVPLQQRAWFPAVQLLPALALGGLWLWDRRRRYLEQHPEVLWKRRARRGLRRQLRRARRAAAARDPGEFVAAAVHALREVCAPPSAATPEALVCADVLRQLPAEERSGRAGELVRRLFAVADARRFAQAEVDGVELLALRPELEQLLDRLKARL